jgi:hypothetical protein
MRKPGNLRQLPRPHRMVPANCTNGSQTAGRFVQSPFIWRQRHPSEIPSLGCLLPRLQNIEQITVNHQLLA